MSYFNAYMEELLDGFVKKLSDRSHITKITNKSEFDAITKDYYSENRGIICDSGIYFMNIGTRDFLHSDLYWFLKDRGMIEGNSYNDDGVFDDELEHYITIQYKQKKIMIGESYSSYCVKQMNTKGTEENKHFMKWKSMMKSVGLKLENHKI